jgi:hypothetical protein
MDIKEQIILLNELKEKMSNKDVWTKGQVFKLIDSILIQYLFEGTEKNKEAL